VIPYRAVFAVLTCIAVWVAITGAVVMAWVDVPTGGITMAEALAAAGLSVWAGLA
jgi:hypothetical protein